MNSSWGAVSPDLPRQGGGRVSAEHAPPYKRARRNASSVIIDGFEWADLLGNQRPALNTPARPAIAGLVGEGTWVLVMGSWAHAGEDVECSDCNNST